ncbi:MAG: HlyD family secretion protein [Saprospiraceae bacterium]|jgi:HlyD family secretion protein|tara:strand:- start:705 stop:1958 length:1254 start_codon:yes stop_codon:yes gene_type:complete
MKKGCLIVSLVIIGLASVGLVYYFMVQNKKDPVVYESVKPKIDDIVKKAVASGSIKPRKEVNIKPQVSGVIEKLYVEAGEIVTKGQKLALIKLIPSEVNINSAKSNLELAKIRYTDALREVERQRSVNSLKLDVQQADANFNLASKELVRQKSLHEQGVISDQDLQRFELDAELKKNTLDNVKISSKNNLASSEIDVELRKQELEAANNNLQLLREGKTSNSRQVSNVVTSTMDGMVLDVPVEEGSSVIERNNFNEGTNIAIVADMGSLIFEGNIDESEVGKLKIGMPLVLKVGAIDGEEFAGVLEFISPKGTVEEGTVNFKIKADIKNENSNTFLRAGYSANADIILEKREQVITINERDIVFKDDKAYVEVEIGDQEYEEKEISTGLSDGVLIEVTSGLDTTIMIKKKMDEGAGN